MSTIAARGQLTARFAGRPDIGAICAWVLPIAVIGYLGFNNGGYGAIERSQAGVVLAWILLVVTGVAAIPLAGGTRAGRVTLGIFLAFTAWTALSMIWTDSQERTMVEVARVGTYAAALALALGARAYWRQMLAGTAVAIVMLCVSALLYRFQPGLFPTRDTTGFNAEVLARLAYPVNYSTGLGAVGAIGLPVLLGMTALARTIPAQAAAAAALPACALTVWLTASGLSVPAAIVGLAVLFALVPDRLPKLATLLVVAGGSAVLFAAEVKRQAIDLGLSGPEAEQQGDELLVIVLVVCVGVGLVQVAISLAARAERPRWLQFTRAQSLTALAVTVGAALLVALAAGAPSRLAGAWDRFESNAAETPVHATRAGTILEYSSNGRYDFWGGALDAAESEPILGRGSGTFEFWWLQHGDGSFVRDAHSLYFETFAELGAIGLLLIVAFTVAVLGIGAARAMRAPPDRRTAIAAATAGGAAFVVAALTDWIWELSVLPAIFIALAGVAVTGGADDERSPRSPWPARIAAGALAVVAVGIIAVNGMTYLITDRLHDSQALARAGDLPGALDRARDAAAIEGFAAAPRLQEALVLEEQGELALAVEAAQRAVDIEPSNWRNWVVLSRLSARIGEDETALDAYRNARALNPGSPLFTDE